MGATIFISYATKDSNKFQIAKIAEHLEKYSEIDNALYWEEDMQDDIYKYMNDNVGRCDVFILFCSQIALKSEPIEMEWMAALKKKKKIIPVFINEDDIPTLLCTRLGVQFRKNDLDGTIKSVYQLILKKLNLSPKKAKKIIIFKGAQILQFEVNVLRKFENLLGKQFKLVNTVEYDTKMGFSVENQRITGIGFYNCGISTLPESIGNLKSLIYLSLGSNKLTTLPESIGNLTSLQRLLLRSNQLSTLPESISNLTSLKKLFLDSNQLTTLPESISNLTSLQTLYLSYNKFTTLPESIGQLSSLQTLWVDSNQLTTLPESIGNLSSLKKLSLYKNQLSTLPESISNLKSLQILWLNSNKLSTLPESIGNLSSLKELWLNSNKLSTLPESIKILEKRGVTIIK